jgi:cold shock CspA family protein
MFGWLIFWKKNPKSKGAVSKKPAPAVPPKVVGSQTENATVDKFGDKFGFLTTASGQKVFVHMSVVPKDTKLSKGDKVQVMYGQATKGMQATQIRKIS